MGKKQRIARKKKETEESKARAGRPVPLKDRTNEKGDGSRAGSRLGDRSRKNKKNKKEKPAPKVGLFVTKELSIAIETTKNTVERIAKECRLKNKRFR